ncbi:response regulator transcription factor [Sphingobium nicotianae]|uniref:Response regulator transcription factor n=1 Tax=Sphingobium nicotianae TaxID=2782607 RepID=A0A9X1DEZ5_9SPHN|nr:response regulator transcription factor [Sphingobium nicotianae]MBT2188328.1 response regulator transcription factor [Sphingobium nicotianae]
MTAQTIVLVEDDPGLRTLIARLLQENGYAVRTAATAPEAWIALENGQPASLVVLDIMLPGTNGIDLCRQIRRTSDVPIIFISAKGSDEDRILGLELGADDFLAKPFQPRELIARVRAVLRRGPLADRNEGRKNEVRFDGWTVYFSKRELRSPEGSIVDLTGAEFDLLGTFIGQPQRVIGRERLIELSRTRLGDSSDRSIDVLVSRLRRKLASAGGSPPIVTVRGIGYMFSATVSHA